MADSFIQPLDAEEVKQGIVTKVAEALWAALDKTCNLYGVAYPKFSAGGVIDCVFDNFGTKVKDRVTFSVTVDIPETPPNVFRKETGQKKPENVLKADDGVQQKAVIFKRTGRARGNDD
jgi:hypothetical protein